MNIKIREEHSDDCPAIYNLIKTAFANLAESDHREHFLAERLHKSDSFIPQLSLVAEDDNHKIIGYILLTKVQIVSKTETKTSLALAPLAVLPEFQNNGIGRLLLTEAHNKAVSLGFESVVVLGHKDYYSKFGYRKAINYGIKFPFDVATEFCMIIELTPHALDGTSGTVHYPDLFFE